MHYTLLPDKEHIAIHSEYHVRVAIVFCFMISLVGIVGIIMLFPAYISSITTEKEQQKVLDSKNYSENSDLIAKKAELSSDAGLLSTINKYRGSSLLSKVISDIIDVRGPTKLFSLVTDRVGTSTVNVIIQGEAPTRDALLSFKSRLQSLKSGNVVDLPISELTKSTPIKFSLKVIEQIP